jgi:UDP-N-acetylglucosamine--N-acetylmuramyl-(pentapeptide) pyrophosphoryl-undecaprenol N-acetylglucosamine transferase
MDLVEHNAGIMLEEKDLDGKVLIELIDKTLNDKDKLEEMKKNLSKLGIKDSSTRIYNTLKELIMNDRKFY